MPATPSRTTRTALSLALLAITAAFAAAFAAEDPRLDDSRRLAAALQSGLGSRLQQALAEGGPVQAIGACRAEAPAIAARLGDSSGARIGRTALRVRNPANAPDAAARVVLDDFAHRLAAGEKGPIEDLRVLADGSVRYMQAIVTQPLCLACHGTAVAGPVRAALARHYPADEATGFSAGDLRGAIIVDWPARETGRAEKDP